jgi:sigma-B regulation protein RsbU (phosphoserine phosphatase)
MNDLELERFHQALRQHKDTLLELLNSDTENKSMYLGGTDESELRKVIAELKETLERMAHGDFGKCTQCSGEVEIKRLENDFTTCVCLDHYSPEQLRALETELELGSAVQRDLLPCRIPADANLRIAAHTESAGVVGGDYYDFFEFQHGLLGAAIADVMHKGLPASILMSNLQASLRILGPQFTSPDRLVERLNVLFRCNMTMIRFISFFVGAIDPHRRILTYCNAGHHPPLWWRRSEGSSAWLNPTGPAIGLASVPSYQVERIEYTKGDIFVLYTDGLVEARDSDGGEFGEENLEIVVKQNGNASPKQLLSAILDEVSEKSDIFHDDVTLVVLEAV